MPKKIPTWNPRRLTPQQMKRERDKRHEEKNPWRAWYRTARWASIRGIILSDDTFCVRCLAKDPPLRTPSDVVNHKRPHRGDPELFWDMSNLEGVCASCHNSEIKREENRSSKR